MKENEGYDVLHKDQLNEKVALSDQELDQVAGGYDETQYNKNDCPNHRVFEVYKCSFCASCKIQYGKQLCDGVMCNTVHYFCTDRGGSGFLMCTHYSLPTGETVKIQMYQ